MNYLELLLLLPPPSKCYNHAWLYWGLELQLRGEQVLYQLANCPAALTLNLGIIFLLHCLDVKCGACVRQQLLIGILWGGHAHSVTVVRAAVSTAGTCRDGEPVLQGVELTEHVQEWVCS